MLSNYASPARCNRQDGRNVGGVSVCIRNDILFNHVPNLPALPPFAERSWFKLPIPKMILLAICIPQNLTATQDETINSYIISCIDGQFADGNLLIDGYLK